MVSTTRRFRLRGSQRADAEAFNRRYPFVRPVVVAYFRRRRLSAEAEVATRYVLATLARTLPRLHPGALRFRCLVFDAVRERELRLRERRLAGRRWTGRMEAACDFDVISTADSPRTRFDRLWVQALILGGLNRLHRERPALYELLEATIPHKRPVAVVARERGVEPALARKEVWRGKLRLMVYLRQQVRCYGSAPRDVAAELRYLSGLVGWTPLPARVGLKLGA